MRSYSLCGHVVLPSAFGITQREYTCKYSLISVVAWYSGNGIGHINKVTLRWALLVRGWVTVFGGQTTSVFHQAAQANSASYRQWVGK